MLQCMRQLGLEAVIKYEHQAPVILTFPASHGMDTAKFIEHMKERGFIIYEGKCSQLATFRVGCMGHVESQNFEMLCDVFSEFFAPLTTFRARSP